LQIINDSFVLLMPCPMLFLYQILQNFYLTFRNEAHIIFFIKANRNFMKEKSKSQTVQRDGGQCEPSCRRLNSALEKAGVATCPVPADIPGMRL
jgi:hypothetical protein